MDDRHILSLLFSRSEQAISALAQRFGASLQRLVCNILPDRRDADEVVSDTYMALWNAIPPKSPEPLSPFVFRTGKHLALKRLRENTAEKRLSNLGVSLEELEGCIPGPCLEDTISAHELGKAIDRFLSGQPSVNRRMFVRRYWYGDSIGQLSADFGIRENAVSLRLLRMRQSLQTFLEKEELL